MSLEATSSPTRITVHPLPEGKRGQAQEQDTSWGGDGFGFDDFIDLINPLQHIPVVGHVYRAITGDEIAPEARILGGAVFGGVVGLAAAGVDAIIETETGATVSEHAIAMVTGEPAIKAPVLEVAEETPAVQTAKGFHLSSYAAPSQPEALKTAALFPWQDGYQAAAEPVGSLDDVLIQAQMLADGNKRAVPDAPYGAKAVKAEPAAAATEPVAEEDSTINETIRYLFSDAGELNAQYQTSQALDHILKVKEGLNA
jgi:hypothetical protein